jgi:hypothetical protein
MHNDGAISLAGLRRHLGLPADSIGELLIVARGLSDPVLPRDQWRLALGDWPEQWRTAPDTAPRFLVMLRRQVIATIEDIDPGGWGLDDAEPAARIVPVRGTADATGVLGGRALVVDLTFGWDEPDERWAFG